MYRVYFDTNEGSEDDGRHGRAYGLWLDRSMEDLAKIPGGPQVGMQVLLYMIGEVEMEATLEFSMNRDGWVAREIAGTMRDNTDTWDEEAE